MKVLQALILHFSSVFNFDLRTLRQRVAAEHFVWEELQALYATDAKCGAETIIEIPPRVEEMEMLKRVKRMRAFMRQWQQQQQQQSLPQQPQQPGSGRHQPPPIHLRLLQIPLDNTLAQEKSIYEMKEQFNLGLNGIYLDKELDTTHRMHQVERWSSV